MNILLKITLIFSIFFFLSLRSTISYAAEDLSVTFHTPNGQPLFSFSNLKPGDHVQDSFQVKNNTNDTKIIRLRATKTDGTADVPLMESLLFVTISQNTNHLFGEGSPTGAKTLADLFALNPNGIVLLSLEKKQQKTFTIDVDFPSSVGNEGQGKSVQFDLLVDTQESSSSGHIVINEVYYAVDRFHWHNLASDRQEFSRDLEDGGWYRDYFWQRRWWVFRKDFQWIELYNPTDKDINLRNWSIAGVGDSRITFRGNLRLKKKEFALLSRDDRLWRFWGEPRGTLKIELGRHIDEGMNPMGDRLTLRNSDGDIVDRMSWGNKTNGFTPAGINPVVVRGASTTRMINGADTDQAGDWTSQQPPTPGR